MTVVPRAFLPRAAVVSRRQLLLGATALALTAAPACSPFGDDVADRRPPAAPSPDPLLALALAARSDAASAAALAAATPAQAGPLRTIATERTAHAQALDAEITRAAGTVAPATSASVPASVTPPATAPPTAAALRSSLQSSQTIAADLARTVPPYRAGLLGSVAAACAAEQAVLL